MGRWGEPEGAQEECRAWRRKRKRRNGTARCRTKLSREGMVCGVAWCGLVWCCGLWHGTKLREEKGKGKLTDGVKKNMPGFSTDILD